MRTIFRWICQAGVSYLGEAAITIFLLRTGWRML